MVVGETHHSRNSPYRDMAGNRRWSIFPLSMSNLPGSSAATTPTTSRSGKSDDFSAMFGGATVLSCSHCCFRIRPKNQVRLGVSPMYHGFGIHPQVRFSRKPLRSDFLEKHLRSWKFLDTCIEDVSLNSCRQGDGAL